MIEEKEMLRALRAIPRSQKVHDILSFAVPARVIEIEAEVGIPDWEDWRYACDKILRDPWFGRTDELYYGNAKNASKSLTTVIESLALLAFMVNGVDFDGMHFQSSEPVKYEKAAEAAS